MENEQDLYSEYESESEPAGRHLSSGEEYAAEYEESAVEEKPVRRPHAGKKSKSKRRKKSKKKRTNWLMTAGLCVLVVIILALIIFLPRRNVVKTPTATPPAVNTAEQGSVVLGENESVITDAQQGTQDGTEASENTIPEPVETPKPAAKVNWNTGDKVKFGSYKQDKGGNTAPLEWKVVKRDGDFAMLVCNNIVKFMKMHDTEESNWDESFIRDWLNNSEQGYGLLYKKGVSFMGTAFSAEEQAAITAMCDVPTLNTSVKDKVFILSLDEARDYSSALGKGCYPTEYAVLEGQRIGLGTLQEGTARWWWLRTTDGEQHFRFINDAGEIDERVKDADNDYGGIRPAVWVDLTKVPA